MKNMKGNATINQNHARVRSRSRSGKRYYLTDLPFDIVCKISNKSDVRTVLRLKVVCKKFYMILSHPDFTKNYRSPLKCEYNGILLFRSSLSMCSMSWHVWPHGAPSITKMVMDFHKVNSTIGLSPCLVSSIHGLTLFKCSGGVTFLYNPITTEKMMLPKSINDNQIRSYGFGFYKGKYKVVLLSSPDHQVGYTDVEVCIVGIGWRSVERSSLRVKGDSGTTLGDSVFWIVEHNDARMILKFNLQNHASEKFPCPGTPPGNSSKYTAELGVVQQSLCVVISDVMGLQVWRKKKKPPVDPVESPWDLILSRGHPIINLRPRLSNKPSFSPKKMIPRYGNLVLIENNTHMVQISRYLYARVCFGERGEYMDAVLYQPTLMCMKDMFGGDPRAYEKLALAHQGSHSLVALAKSS
ncbi:hypothetical protein R6Q57_020304 [Mikania cordata]